MVINLTEKTDLQMVFQGYFQKESNLGSKKNLMV